MNWPVEASLGHFLVRLQRRPLFIVAAVVAVLAVSLPGLLLLKFDMSFRPLFAGTQQDLAATASFEAEFGQVSGAYLVAILETPDPTSAAFLQALKELGDRVARLEGVASVRSLAHMQRPVWSAGRIQLQPVSPAAQVPTDDSRLLAENGRRTLLLARVDIPLSDLNGRALLIEQYKTLVNDGLPTGSSARFTGVSVVEDAYAKLVLRNVLIGVTVTMLALAAILWLFFGRLSSVLACLAGVCLATPATLGLMGILGHPMTIINSMVPTMVMIIGVADAIHMHESYLEHLGRGLAPTPAMEGMLARMTLPCLTTSLTTVAGMLALLTAQVAAIRDFGVNAAMGLILVSLLNLLVVPQLLMRLRRAQQGTGWLNIGLGRLIALAAQRSISNPGLVLTIALLALVPLVWWAPSIELDQRFNEELPREHPVRANQALLEQEFDGLLGPELSIHRADGGIVVDGEALQRIAGLLGLIRADERVLSVRSLWDFIPVDADAVRVPEALITLRRNAALPELKDLLSADSRGTALVVRTTDMGSKRAAEFSAWLQQIAANTLGDDYRIELVGQWWLAQQGMQQIVADMLRSFLTALLLVLPLLGLVLRRWRLFLLSLLPNLIPTVVALGFMALAGINLRIGTAMILAIALGIAVDDTIHFLIRLRNAVGQMNPADAVRDSLNHTGKAIVLTTLVLVVGFLTMLSNELVAIRDMGMVAAVTILAALVADLIVTPALYLVSLRRAAR
ncbi:MAG: MMPL family transporter [Gammaproteobacteria bacterium]